MTEFLITTAQTLPENTELCSLEAKVTDKGVEITAKSSIIGAYVKKICSKKKLLRGVDYNISFDGLFFYCFSPSIGNELGTNLVTTDLFHNIGGMDEYGNRRKQEPNMLWLITQGLEEGITITFAQPAHIPADIMEYLNRCMEKMRLFYTKNMRQIFYKATLIERN